jgi:hypothetical protein
MQTNTRLLLGALTAALALASALSTAAANRLSISNVNFRTVWRPLTFSSSEEGAGITLACNLTLEGSFHSNTTEKVRGRLIGYVTKAAMGHPCSGTGEAWTNNGVEEAGLGVIASTLPWHLTYEGFEGTLPTIIGIRLLARPRYTVRAPMVGLCSYEGNAEGVVNLNRAGVVASHTPDSRVAIGKVSGGILCAASGFFAGNPEASTVTVLGSTQTITIRLI